VGAIAPVDPARPPSRIKRIATRWALSRPGNWLYSRFAQPVDLVLARVSGGRLNTGMNLIPIVFLTARGAKSGLERTVPLVYFTDGDDVIVIATSFGRPRYPSWYRNVTANPEVTLEANGRSALYRAREVTGADHDELLARAEKLYTGYGVYQQRLSGVRHVPVMRLSPV
jgi:deazaflavin-dependent oxidoreductase (nitroreductase family)